ncbi:unnamed protein product [Toxocara canis]|uniref:Uncharacterized protein n=1 Tax=Toxocara canis TaxID=6265 RepID=A0A183U8Z3_TOXCA|nr:unnamed protein product [Toxocara canis]
MDLIGSGAERLSSKQREGRWFDSSLRRGQQPQGSHTGGGLSLSALGEQQCVVVGGARSCFGKNVYMDGWNASHWLRRGSIAIIRMPAVRL